MHRSQTGAARWRGIFSDLQTCACVAQTHTTAGRRAGLGRAAPAGASTTGGAGAVLDRWPAQDARVYCMAGRPDDRLSGARADAAPLRRADRLCGPAARAVGRARSARGLAPPVPQRAELGCHGERRGNPCPAHPGARPRARAAARHLSRARRDLHGSRLRLRTRPGGHPVGVAPLAGRPRHDPQSGDRRRIDANHHSRELRIDPVRRRAA